MLWRIRARNWQPEVICPLPDSSDREDGESDEDEDEEEVSSGDERAALSDGLPEEGKEEEEEGDMPEW